MVKNQWNLSKFNNGSLIICLLYLSLGICLLYLSLGTIYPAQAEYGKPETEDGNDAPSAPSTGIGGTRYRKPETEDGNDAPSAPFTGIGGTRYRKPETEGGNDAPNAQSTGVAATRSGSCNPADNNLKANAPTFTTLAPYEHVGQSSTTNPTFTWYISDRESYPVEFGLYEFDPAKYNGRGKQIYQTSLSSSMGMMTHSLPTEVSLVPGKTYVWQVAVICNPNSPSQSLVANNRIEIVEIDPVTASQLNLVENPAIKADIYAQSGLWYDAMAEVVTLSDDPQARDAMIELIDQLAAIEPDRNNLRQIVNSLQPE